MSDAEINQAALEDWFETLGRLWLAFDKPIDPVRLMLYRDMLNKIPTGLLELAIERTIRDHGKYNNVPTVGEVWEAIRVVLHNPYDLDQAITDLSARQFEACVVRFGAVVVETEAA